MPTPCNAKLVAPLGPASADRATIEALVRAGADVFRLNFSHGTHADHQARLDLIRAIESDLGRPLGVLLDLQGPKLRVGTFANGPVQLVEGAAFRLCLDTSRPGDVTQVAMPHPEIFAALTPGAELLLAGRLAAASCAEAGALAVTAGFLPKENMGVLPLYSSHWFQIMKREANKTAPKMVRRVSLFMGG